MNSTANTTLECTFSSVLGTDTVSINGINDQVQIPINEKLGGITGMWSHEYAKGIEAFKNIPMEFNIRYWDYKGYAFYDLIGIEWNFGDNSTSTSEQPTHAYLEPGEYIAYANITFEYNNQTFNVVEGMYIDILLKDPTPVINIYQECSLNLRITGRRGNTVSLRVFEDGILIQDCDLTRTAGPPDTTTIEANKYIDRNYEIELVYTATHCGTNPIVLQFTSGRTSLFYVHIFKTNDGYNQIIQVPTLYLNTVANINPTYWFDASESFDVDGQIATFTWDFGDGSSSPDVLASHTYSITGVYVVSLTVTDDDERIASSQTSVTATVLRPHPPHKINPCPPPIHPPGLVP